MPRANYDPAKAHDYYERTKDLKGRHHGGGQGPKGPRQAAHPQAHQQAQVAQIQAKLDRLRALLQEKIAASHKQSKADHKPTAGDKLKEKQRSAEYYKKHKQQIANLHQKAGGGGGAAAKPKTAADMSIDELRTTIRNTVTQLRQAIAQARRR